ncbi:MAG: hypothetical protein CMF62_04345 [Magnetococcales bacterium]|nr:hypothetical protein [Magnetococcales bacterium]
MYEFNRGCHTGDASDRFYDLDETYDEVSQLIKYHYKDKNITKESLKDEDFLTDNWLWNFRKDVIDKSENFSNEIINILDSYGIIICKSKLLLRENDFYFILPHPYFNKMKTICELIRIQQI